MRLHCGHDISYYDPETKMCLKCAEKNDDNREDE